MALRTLTAVRLATVTWAAEPPATEPEWFPARLGDLPREGAVRSFDAQTIVDYMDGQADIYFTYAFQRLHVAVYRLGEQKLTAELYDMKSAAEAFGIWSNDLDGEPAGVLQASLWQPGMLRGWQGRYFVKIQAVTDEPAVKPAALALARQWAARLPVGAAAPPLQAALPAEELDLHRFRYFHRDTNLNSFQYISTVNVLGLEADTQGSMAECRRGGEGAKIVLIEYPQVARRDQAWTAFRQRVLSGKAQETPAGDCVDDVGEGRFTGARRVMGPHGEARLALCFEAASREACLAVLAAMEVAARRR